MMSGIDGNKDKKLIKQTWEQFQTWQRWDEFPDRCDNPPMTVDVTFWYENNEYYLDQVDQKFAILSKDWEIIASDLNFLKLLTTPVDIWKGKTFQESIENMVFEN